MAASSYLAHHFHHPLIAPSQPIMPSLPNSLEISFDDIARIVTYRFESIDGTQDIIHERLDELAEDQTGDQYIVFQGINGRYIQSPRPR